MSQTLRTNAAGGLESHTRRGTRLQAARQERTSKGNHKGNDELPCSRPGCSRKRGRGRQDKLVCSERCRWKARDEELLRLRQGDFEALVEERACPECREGLMEAVRTKR